MEIVGRKDALKKLDQCDLSLESMLVCVYGRRRVGKTHLITKYYRQHLAFHIEALEGVSTREQLAHFGEVLRSYGDDKPHPKNWTEAFLRLNDIINRKDVPRTRHGKRVVFLDEFPWFETSRSNFRQTFAMFWDTYCAHEDDIIVIICGSATSWVIDNVLQANSSTSLYKRITCPIRLLPFTLAETREYFQKRNCDWSQEQLLECQMIFGGLPYFFSLLDTRTSLYNNIDELCLSELGILREETSTLLETTLGKSSGYGKMLRELSKHKYGVAKKDLPAMLGVAPSQIADWTRELKKCMYVDEYNHPSRSHKPTFVRLADPFILFHYSFLADECEKISSWTMFRQSGGRYSNWRGNAFEILCLYHKDLIQKLCEMASIEANVYPWTSSQKKGGAQIDIVLERKKVMNDLIELKFTDGPFELTYDYAKALENKRNVYKKEADSKTPARIIMISANGFEHTERADHVVSKFISGEELFGS